MKVSYNAHADVLYIVLSPTQHHCSYVELPGGIITRIEDETNRVVGVTIYNFSSKMKTGESVLIPQASVDLLGPGLINV